MIDRGSTQVTTSTASMDTGSVRDGRAASFLIVPDTSMLCGGVVAWRVVLNLFSISQEITDSRSRSPPTPLIGIVLPVEPQMEGLSWSKAMLKEPRFA